MHWLKRNFFAAKDFRHPLCIKLSGGPSCRQQNFETQGGQFTFTLLLAGSECYQCLLMQLLLLLSSFIQICIDKYPYQQCIFRIYTNKQTKASIVYTYNPTSFHHRLTTRGCKRLTHVSFISTPPFSLTLCLLIPISIDPTSSTCWLITR